jgi:hypothetical protein
MRHGGGEEEKAGRVTRARNEIEGAIKVATGQRGLVGGVFDDFGTRHQRGLVLDAVLAQGSPISRDGFDDRDAREALQTEEAT